LPSCPMVLHYTFPRAGSVFSFTPASPWILAVHNSHVRFAVHFFSSAPLFFFSTSGCCFSPWFPYSSKFDSGVPPTGVPPQPIPPPPPHTHLIKTTTSHPTILSATTQAFSKCSVPQPLHFVHLAQPIGQFFFKPLLLAGQLNLQPLSKSAYLRTACDRW